MDTQEDQEKKVTLQPVAMVVPIRERIYAPSPLRKKRVISFAEFLTTFADNPCSIQVSFAPDGESNPQLTTAYGCGLDCWYIVDTETQSEFEPVIVIRSKR